MIGAGRFINLSGTLVRPRSPYVHDSANNIMQLLEIFRRNVNKNSFFAKILDIDFYDGPTEAICQLVDSNEWLICSIVYFKPEEDDRIFSVIQVDSAAILDLVSNCTSMPKDGTLFYEKAKERIKSVYNTYKGDVFLLKSQSLIDQKYEIVQISLKDLNYFASIDDVIMQSESSKLRWKSFFISK